MDEIEPTPAATTFHLEGSGGHPVLTVVGELDVASVGGLTVALDRALVGAESVRVDLAGVSFADSTALGALVGAHERAVAAGKVLCVSAVSDVVDALFHIAGLSDELRC